MKKLKIKPIIKNLIISGYVAILIEAFMVFLNFSRGTVIIVALMIFLNMYSYLNLVVILNKMGQKIHNVETNHFFKNKEFEED